MKHLNRIFFVLALVIASTFSASSAGTTFNVFRADGKLVIADQPTYKLIIQQQGNTPGIADITKNAGITLPTKIGMSDALNTIQTLPQVTVAFITQGEQVAELVIARDQKTYSMSVDDQYDPARATEYFGGILGTLVPNVDALLAALKPGTTVTRSLTPVAAPSSAPIKSEAAVVATSISAANLKNNTENNLPQCPICLDDIEDGQPLDLCKTCNNAWHQQCAGAPAPSNLSKCPVCRGTNILRMAIVHGTAVAYDSMPSIPSASLPPIPTTTQKTASTQTPQVSNSMPDIPSSSLPPIKQTRPAQSVNQMPDIPSSSLVPDDSTEVQIPSSSLPPIKQTRPAQSVNQMPDIPSSSLFMPKETLPVQQKTADLFDKSTSSPAEYYVYLQDGSVYITYDKSIAQGVTETNKDNAIVITRMTDPTKREFVQSNVTKAKNYFAAIKGDMTIFVYQNKNVIAKIPCKDGALVKNIVYFDKAKRDTLIKDYGTAIRYLLGLDSNTKKYESSLVIGKL